MFEEFDLIHRYSRADALRDGVLIDVSPTAAEAGFRWPVALTRAVWERCVRTRSRNYEQCSYFLIWGGILLLFHQAIQRLLGLPRPLLPDGSPLLAVGGRVPHFPSDL